MLLVLLAAGCMPVTPKMDESNQTSLGGVSCSEWAESALGGVAGHHHHDRITAIDDAVSLRATATNRK